MGEQKRKDPKTLYLIPRTLTNKTIPNMTRENMKDFYHYMIDILRLLSVNNGIYELLNGDRIVNCSFHCKYTGQILYCYAKKLSEETNRGYKWKFENKLYTKTELIRNKGVSARTLPRALMLNVAKETGLTQKNITKRMNTTKWAKITVNNINNKETNKCKLTLAMTVETFKEHIRKYND